MPRHVVYHLRGQLQIKQITGSAWPLKRGVFGVTKDYTPAPINHIVDMIEATPSVTEFSLRQMITPDHNRPHVRGLPVSRPQAELVTHRARRLRPPHRRRSHHRRERGPMHTGTIVDPLQRLSSTVRPRRQSKQ